MSLLDDLNSSASGIRLDGAERFQRLRARRIPDDSNPMQTMDDWTNPEVLELSGALSSSSSTRTPDVLDVRTTSVAYLTVADPSADVRVGDRIRPDPDDGRMWEVTGVPAHDRNAFTGWRPTLEISLTEWRG